MSTLTSPSQQETMVNMLYKNLLQAWNNMDATKFASLFTKDGSMVGFDGTQKNRRDEIEKHLSEVFANHKVASFIGLIREVRFLTDDVALLRAEAGMVPPGKKEINPATNAVQSMLVQKYEDKYRIVHFHNTPAAFHERPQDAEKLTNELQRELELARDAG
jgi:uncharacterized protein (TIGR02246 family)